MQRLLVGLFVAWGWVIALAQEPAVPVRVGTQGVSQPRLIFPVKPAARFSSGAVSMEVTISPQGLVSDVRIAGRASPFEPLGELEQGIVDAVREWRFEPTVVNGAAVPVLATVTVNNRAASRSPSPEMVTGTRAPVSASLTVNFNRYYPVEISSAAAAAQQSVGADSTMPVDFAVRYVSLCPPNQRGSLTIDTAADEAWFGGRVRLGVRAGDLERIYLGMRDGGTFADAINAGWNEPVPSGITTLVRPDGVEVTVNHVSSPTDRKDTVPWMAEFGWNLEFRLNAVWRRSARVGFGTQRIDPPFELPLLLDLLWRSDDVKRLSVPLPRACS